MWQKRIKDKVEKTREIIKVQELVRKDEKLEQSHFSKINHELITKEIKEKLEFGEYLHYLFEIVDFKKKDLPAPD